MCVKSKPLDIINYSKRVFKRYTIENAKHKAKPDPKSNTDENSYKAHAIHEKEKEGHRKYKNVYLQFAAESQQGIVYHLE